MEPMITARTIPEDDGNRTKQGGGKPRPYYTRLGLLPPCIVGATLAVALEVLIS